MSFWERDLAIVFLCSPFILCGPNQVVSYWLLPASTISKWWSTQVLPIIFSFSGIWTWEELSKDRRPTWWQDSEDTAHHFLLIRVPDVTWFLPTVGLDALFFLKLCEKLNILLRNQVLFLKLPWINFSCLSATKNYSNYSLYWV